MKNTFSVNILLGYLLLLCDTSTGIFESVTRNLTGFSSLYDLCPFTNYCSKNATGKLEGKFLAPCCGNCSCADDCWERANCCADKQTIIAKQPLETCEPVGVNRDQKLGWGYYVITRCPTEESALAKNSSGEQQALLEGLIWVTDRRTNKIYRNKHCALCHGVDDYTVWQVETDCMRAMDGQNSPNKVEKHIMDKCSLTVQLPSMEDHTDNICLIPEITECNVTGKWKVYNQGLETACRSFQQTYMRGSRFRTVVYRNIYCFLCNSQYTPLLLDVCPPVPMIGRGQQIGFTGILNYKAFAMKEDGGSSVPACGIDEVKDSFQKRCRKLSCPFLQAPAYDQCVNLLSGSSSFVVSAMLLFYPKRGKIDTAYDVLSFQFEDVAKELHNRVGQALGRCKLCAATIFVTYANNTTTADGQPFPETFSYRLFIFTTKRCQETQIVERLYGLLGTDIELPFGQEYMTFNISAAKDKNDYENYLSNADDSYAPLTTMPEGPVCPPPYYPDFQELIGCTSVSLNSSDYTALMRSTKQTHQFFIQTNRYGRQWCNCQRQWDN